MPDIFDLDRAFEDLTQHVGDHTHAPGAERVARAARTRRRTRVGVGVGALALIVGGGVALGSLTSAPDVRYADGLPAPEALSPAVLDRLTAGWVSGWEVPTAQSQITGDSTRPLDACANALLSGDDQDEPVRTGAAIFVAGKALAFARGGEASSAAVAAGLLSKVAPGAACQDLRTSEPAADTEVITATASGGGSGAVFAVVRWHDRFAFAGVSAPDSAPSAGVQDALGQALLAAVQDDAIVSTMPPILQTSMGGSHSQSATSSDATTYSMTDPTASDLQTAFGGWAAGYLPTGSNASMNTPDCLRDTASSSSGSSVGNLAVVTLSSYDSPDGAQRALTDTQASLTSCGFTTEGPTGDFVVASKGGAHPVTLWFLRSDSHVAWVQLDGSAAPPQQVTDAVRALLASAVTTIVEEQHGPVASASGKAGS